MKNTEEEILTRPYSLSEKSKLFLAQICRNIPLEKISATWKGVVIWVVVDSKPVSGFDANSALYKICTEKYHLFEGSYLLKQALIFWKEVVVSKWYKPWVTMQFVQCSIDTICADVGRSFKLLCICVFCIFVFARLTNGNVIFDILEQSQSKTYHMSFWHFVI